MSEENKAIAQRWNRIFEGQASEADAIIAPNIVYHDAPPGIPVILLAHEPDYADVVAKDEFSHVTTAVHE